MKIYPTKYFQKFAFVQETSKVIRRFVSNKGTKCETEYFKFTVFESA